MIAQINKAYLKLSFGRIYSRFLSYLFFEGRPLTTKGRWFNFVVFTLFRIICIFPALKKKPAVAFIIGTGRSGTTVLGIGLSSHKEIGFLNEPKAIWHHAYKREDIVGNYTQGISHYRIGASEANNRVAARLKKIYSAYLVLSRNKIVLDKYPEQVFRTDFIDELLPESKYIFIARNGWDTIQSISRWSENHGTQQGNDKEDWWGINDKKWHLLVEDLVKKDDQLSVHYDTIKKVDDHTERAAIEWILTMKEGLALKERYSKDRLLFIDYESLTHSPRNMGKKLTEFMGLREDKTFLDYFDQILKPNKAKAPIKLPDYLKEEFQNTMRSLGYED
ncbi:MAG: hypothetical protein Roseis2KO_22260 [Roseivirga sp.]